MVAMRVLVATTLLCVATAAAVPDDYSGQFGRVVQEIIVILGFDGVICYSVSIPSMQCI